MKHIQLAIAALSLGCAAASAAAAPPPGGGRHAGPPGADHGGGYNHGGGYRPYYPGYRPIYPGYRPIYSGWRGGYWGPGVGVYIGGPGYWGAWPYGYGYGYGWGAAYGVPYAVAPLVVSAAPAPQVVVPQPHSGEPDGSYWYYCAQPAGYFPYVQECAQAWMKVVPQVPGSTTTPPRLAP